MENSYVLPVEAIVEVMKHSPELVDLHSVSPLSPLSKEPCVARLVLGQGKLASCTITTTTGNRLFEGQQAYTALLRCGAVQWRVSPAPALVRQPPSFSRPEVVVPLPQHVPCLRVKELPPALLASLSHSHRRVLALVDGKRSLAEIALLLATTPEKVSHTLSALAHLVQCSLLLFL